MRKPESWIRLGIVAVLAAGAMACASSGPRQVSDELKSGFKAAKRGYWQEALLRFEVAYRMESDNPRVVNNYAVALEAVGRFEDARDMYEKALSLGDSKVAKRNFNRFQEVYDSFVKPSEPTKPVQTPQEQEQ